MIQADTDTVRGMLGRNTQRKNLMNEKKWPTIGSTVYQKTKYRNTKKKVQCKCFSQMHSRATGETFAGEMKIVPNY